MPSRPVPCSRTRGKAKARSSGNTARRSLQKPVSPEDVAGAIRFLLDTPSITGQMIALDGGQHLAWKGAGGSG